MTHVRSTVAARRDGRGGQYAAGVGGRERAADRVADLLVILVGHERPPTDAGSSEA